MYFDLEDRHPADPEAIEGAITRREAIILSIAAHIVIGNLIIWLPTMPWFQKMMEPSVVAQPLFPARSRIGKTSVSKLTAHCGSTSHGGPPPDPPALPPAEPPTPPAT